MRKRTLEDQEKNEATRGIEDFRDVDRRVVGALYECEGLERYAELLCFGVQEEWYHHQTVGEREGTAVSAGETIPPAQTSGLWCPEESIKTTKRRWGAGVVVHEKHGE